jgi:hypothetical protein
MHACTEEEAEEAGEEAEDPFRQGHPQFRQDDAAGDHARRCHQTGKDAALGVTGPLAKQQGRHTHAGEHQACQHLATTVGDCIGVWGCVCGVCVCGRDARLQRQLCPMGQHVSCSHQLIHSRLKHSMTVAGHQPPAPAGQQSLLQLP